MEVNQVYKCNICGNIVELLHVGGGQLVCCGQPMELLKEKNEEEGQEKHRPVINIKNEEIEVRIGEILHPMEENHFIEWVEIFLKDRVYRRFLKPGEEPIVSFFIKDKPERVRIYCNIHGLWRN